MPARSSHRVVRVLVIAVASLGTLAMLGISMRLNYLFGFSLGQTPERAHAFAWVNVAADLWKGLGPIFLYALVREKCWFAATAAGVVWLVCFVFAISSALGLAMQDRSTLTGGRESLRAKYETTQMELQATERKYAGLAKHRSAGEIGAARDMVLARPTPRGTIGAVTKNCSKPDRGVEACAEVASLRHEMAVAVEAERLEHALVDLRGRVGLLRERGGTLASDPQAQLLSRLTFGWLSVSEVGMGLVVLLAGVIEVVSAFGPAVISIYGETTRTGKRKKAVGRRAAPMAQMSRGTAPASPMVGNVIDYLAERVEPTGDDDAVGVDEFHADYAVWCGRYGRAPLDHAAFEREIDRAREEHGLVHRVRKGSGGYQGLKLAASP